MALVVVLGMLAAVPAIAQNPALDLARERNAELNPAMREDLKTLGRYAEAVGRQVDRAPLPPAAAGGRRLDAVGDPFEVSPQLRAGRRPGTAFGGLPAAGRLELQRQVQVRALLITARQRIAQLSVRQKEVITVADRELVDLGDLGVYEVRIERDAVVLLNPGSPQSSKVVLR
jgi:hypothetical protein